MKMRRFAACAVLAMAAAWAAPAANAQPKSVAGNVEAGRTLALWACTGCHIVAPDQRFKPIYTGTPHPPDFKAIANKPAITAAWLQHHLESLPVVPKDSLMANPDLTSDEIRDVVAFIISIRDKPEAPAQ